VQPATNAAIKPADQACSPLAPEIDDIIMRHPELHVPCGHAENMNKHDKDARTGTSSHHRRMHRSTALHIAQLADISFCRDITSSKSLLFTSSCSHGSGASASGIMQRRSFNWPPSALCA
jgi:hypothetical protein